MKCILLSAVYQNRQVVLKFYEPFTNKLILWRDNTDHLPHCYVTDFTAEQIKEYDGIVKLEPTTVFDVIQDKKREMVKVIARDPLVIGGTDTSIRESYPCYEADIKYYQTYLYDKGLIVGKWYKVGETITPVDHKSVIDLPSINTESVIEVEKFLNRVKDWASLLDAPIPNIKRLAFDIEVETSKSEMPDPLVAAQRVTAIGFEDNNSLKQVFVLKRPEVPMGESCNDCKVVWFDSEKAMLEEAFKIIETYPMVLTYNGDAFDMPYLYTRAINLGISSTPFRMMKNNATLLLGVHIDLYGVFSNHSLKVYAFKNKYTENSLNEVCNALLSEKKIEYDGELDEIPLNLLGRYCYNDARLTMKLTTYNNNLVMKLLIILCRIGNMPIDDISRMAISNWIKSLLYFTHRQNNELIPRSDDFPQVEASTKAIISDKKYQGAVVLEPQKGIHFNVTALDFASLYPSIIKTRNVSYETIRCSHEECKTNKIPQTDHWSCTKKTGIVSLLIGSLKELRVGYYKKLSKEENRTDEEKQQYDVISESIKVFLNASYGVIGFESFPLYYLPTAEAVTAVGRDIITNTVNEAKSQGMNVIMGDTDSFYVKDPKPEQIQHMLEWTKNTYKIDLEVDKEYRYIVLSNRKKNYFGVKKDGKLDIKGLTGKKSHTPPFIKKLFTNVLDELKKIETPDQFASAREVISKMIKDTITNFDSIPLEQIAFKMMINKEPSEYKTKTQAIKALELLGTQIKKGQFVSFVKTWTKPLVKPIQIVERKEIDKPKYIETLQTTLEQVTDPMELDFDSVITGQKQTSLDGW